MGVVIGGVFLGLTFFVVMQKVTDEQQSITFAFPHTMIINKHALDSVWPLKEGVASFQHWGSHGLATLPPLLLRLCIAPQL